MDTYTFDIEHRSGKRHENVDAMPRDPGILCGDAGCVVCVITRTQTGRQTKARDAAGGQEDVGREEERISSFGGKGSPGERKRRRPRRQALKEQQMKKTWRLFRSGCQRST